MPSPSIHRTSARRYALDSPPSRTHSSHAPRSEFPQIRQEGRAQLGTRRAIEVYAVSRRGWRDHAGRGERLDALEELHVVIDDFFERSGAVVVEVGRGRADPAQSGHVELIPIVIRAGAADKPGQQRTTRIRTGAANLGPGRKHARRALGRKRQDDLVGARVVDTARTRTARA